MLLQLIHTHLRNLLTAVMALGLINTTLLAKDVEGDRLKDSLMNQVFLHLGNNQIDRALYYNDLVCELYDNADNKTEFIRSKIYRAELLRTVVSLDLALEELLNVQELLSLIHLYNEGVIEKQDLKKMMAKLEASAVSVNFLIENLLNWVLSQKESLKPVYKSFNLSELVTKTCLEVESQLKAKDLSLKVQGFKSEEYINSDDSMINLVLRNVLSNPIKFSRKGSEVILSYKKDESHHHIIVQDFGVGMTKLEVAKLTEGEISSQFGTSNEKGTGLGLALSKEFLTALEAS